MRLVRYMDNGVEFLGRFYENEGIVKPIDVSNNMNELIINFDKFKKYLENDAPSIPLEKVTLLAPI